MKRLSITSSILAGVCMAATLTSCSQEDISLKGGDGMVTFTVQAPDMGTRAYGDGMTASNLQCLVYAGSKHLQTINTTLTNGQANVSLSLVKGVDYNVVFWASAPTSPYVINAEDGTMTINYDAMLANDDANDAFYKAVTCTGGEDKEKTVLLTRPLAQINFGTDDINETVVNNAYPDGVYANATVTAFSTLNLLSGDMTDEAEFSTKVAQISSLANQSFPVTHPQSTVDAPKAYTYTHMVYALVPDSRTTSTVTLHTYADAEATKKIWTLPVSNTPLRQNYRTNIFGSLLTSNTDFSVTIAPNMATLEDIDPDHPKPVTVTPTTPEELATVWASNATDITVTLAAPIEGGINIPDSSVPRVVTVDLNGQTTTPVQAGKNVTVNLYNNAPATRARTDGRAEQPLIVANNGGTINVYGGKYYTYGVEAVQIHGGMVNIYDGEFSSFYPTSVPANTTKVINKVSGTLYVELGRFQAKSSTYPNTDFDRDADVTQIGVTGIKTDAKISREFDSSATQWVVIENAWHPGVTKTLTWTSIGQGRLEDAWLGSFYSWDLPLLTVDVQRCNEYPTLYRIHNPYKNVKTTWNCNTANLTVLEEGEIRFDMQDPTMVAVGGGFNTGGMYKSYPCFAANYEGETYYTTGQTLSSYKEDLISMGATTSSYDAATNTVNFRNLQYHLSANDAPQHTSYLGKACYLVMPAGFTLQ